MRRGPCDILSCDLSSVGGSKIQTLRVSIYFRDGANNFTNRAVTFQQNRVVKDNNVAVGPLRNNQIPAAPEPFVRAADVHGAKAFVKCNSFGAQRRDKTGSG